ncbi:MAG: competence protein ComEA [Gammaproteobacteria bacterium HGW-Gammaproteobacteria-7]|nr:MAG: competence protein ComEA [Gammaproteobacteria bacterium HGW-Gammaproteobacteria-7]
MEGQGKALIAASGIGEGQARGIAAGRVRAHRQGRAVTQASVNLNTADAATLTRELKGIGATKAKAIVDYREEHGPFSSVDELLEVKGIGSATLQKIRSQLSVQ